MQCKEYSKIWRNLIFAALNLKFIRGDKAFPVFHSDLAITGLPCGQGQLSRIWKVQCDRLSLGKECCSRLKRLLEGMRDALPWEATQLLASSKISAPHQFSPHVRESKKVLDSGFYAVDSGFQTLSVELGFWIPNVSGIPDSLSCIPDPKAQDSGFHV